MNNGTRGMHQGVSVPHVGRTVPRRDAEAKVRGREKFAADYYGDHFLWAGVKRAGVPHAVMRGVQTDAAARLPGVVAVLTSRDVRGTNRQGVIRKDQPVLVDDRIRHRGDAVALVLAEDRQALERAIAAVSIDCDPLPGVFDMEAALEPGACRIHPDHADGNTLLQGKLETGDVEAAFAECDAVIEGRFDLPVQEHAYLETEAGWAVCREEGRVEIVASTQTPFRDRMEVAEAIGLDPAGVRIIAPYCGGAFGGKDGITVQSLLGLSALRCPGRPVKMWWGREESFVAGSKRHRARVHYRVGALKDGGLHAVDFRAYYDTGPYDHLGGAVMALGLEHAAGPYRIPNVRLRGWAVYTNNPIGGAFRGFGVPQVTAGMEQMIDRLAERLGISPIEMRLRNAVRRGDRNAAGVTLTTSTGIEDCLRTLAVHPLYTGRARWKAEAGTHARRGAGIACVMHGMGYGPVVPDAANAKIELTREGRFRVYAGVVDMGQGNANTYLQIAADILNQDMDRVDLVLPDTDLTLPSGSASASRTTYTFGNALIQAAEILKDRVLDRAADLFMARGRQELALIPGGLRHLPSGRDIQLADMAQRLDAAERTATHRFRAPTAVETLSADPSLRLHGVPHLIFSYGVHYAGVEVDLLTGQVRVLQYLAVTDAGAVINPQLFDQQIHGGIAQGLGYGLFEDFGVEQGAVTTPDLATYVIPGALDIPDMVSVPIRQPEHTGPFGLKGVGEVAVDGPLPAVANALADACDIRLERFPMTAERVLDALERKGSGVKGGLP